MDADTEMRQRKNVSVKSNCCRTAQRELIPRHTLRSQPASSALTEAQKENFPTPTKLQIHLLRFPVSFFHFFFIRTNPEFRNQQTTPSKKRFPPRLSSFSMMLRTYKGWQHKNTHYPTGGGGIFRPLWPTRLNLKFDNPFVASSYVQRSVCSMLHEQHTSSGVLCNTFRASSSVAYDLPHIHFTATHVHVTSLCTLFKRRKKFNI